MPPQELLQQCVAVASSWLVLLESTDDGKDLLNPVNDFIVEATRFISVLPEIMSMSSNLTDSDVRSLDKLNEVLSTINDLRRMITPAAPLS